MIVITLIIITTISVLLFRYFVILIDHLWFLSITFIILIGAIAIIFVFIIIIFIILPIDTIRTVLKGSPGPLAWVG